MYRISVDRTCSIIVHHILPHVFIFPLSRYSVSQSLSVLSIKFHSVCHKVTRSDISHLGIKWLYCEHTFISNFAA